MSNPDLASWVFGTAGLLYLAAIATYLMVRKRSDSLAPAAGFIIGFLCAIAGGFCTYFFSGKLGLDFQVPGTNIKGNAAGGIGVFVLVLLLWIRYSTHGIRQVNINVETAPAQTLEAIDRVLTNLEHVWAGVSAIEHGQFPTPSVKHARQGRGKAEEIRFTQTGQTSPLQVLTVDEVRQRLSDAEMRLLIDTEASMQDKVKAWRREYAMIGNPAAANEDGKMRLLRIASGMSDDLDAIFGAIERTLDGQLQDHYGGERWIASRAEGILQQLQLDRAEPIPNAGESKPSPLRPRSKGNTARNS